MKIENAAGYPYAGQRSQSKATNRSTATSFAAELATSLANRAGPDNSSISAAARHAFSASTAVPSASNFSTSVDAKLAEIRARGPVNRSQEDGDYLLANDKRLAEIRAQGKSSDQLTADQMTTCKKPADSSIPWQLSAQPKGRSMTRLSPAGITKPSQACL